MAESKEQVDGSLTVLDAVRGYFKEAEEARESRILKNRANHAAFMSDQDWSHKQDGQSTEFLPKSSVAVEQFTAFVKRALVQFGDWFSVEAKAGPLTPESRS